MPFTEYMQFDMLIITILFSLEHFSMVRPSLARNLNYSNLIYLHKILRAKPDQRHQGVRGEQDQTHLFLPTPSDAQTIKRISGYKCRL